MYEVLIAHLRECAKLDSSNNTYAEAANAIEELSMKLHGDEAAIAGMQREIEHMVVYGNKPRWIPVTEMLPDLYEDVQILFPNNQAAGFYDGCGWCTYTGDTWYSMVGEEEVKPTHWAKKLPEPPKEE